jgi:hypothetical protein
MNKQRIRKLVFYLVLLIVQAILMRFLADKQVITALFSAGARLHVGAAVAALVFVTLRLFIVLFLPSLLACEVLTWWLDRRKADGPS